MNILLTGGMGFIGSHTAVALLEAGHNVVLFDNLSNADRSVIDRIETIAGRRPVFIEDDIRDAGAMEQALEGIDTVIHFAGLKAVGESVSKPIEYYDNNVNGTLVLLAAMRKKGLFWTFGEMRVPAPPAPAQKLTKSALNPVSLE